MKNKFYPPKFNLPSFHCSFCEVYAKQNWKVAYEGSGRGGLSQVDNIFFSVCSHCGGRSIWLNEQIIAPFTGGVEAPNKDLPSDIILDYLEAREILNKSPRGAAALLRLAIQKLCKVLGESGKSLNEDIAGLVKKGMPVKIQQALDYVRVIGNNAVHPGQIEFSDNPDTALKLFNLINIICEVMISQPKVINTLYNSLPADILNEIGKRDKKNGN